MVPDSPTTRIVTRKVDPNSGRTETVPYRNPFRELYVHGVKTVDIGSRSTTVPPVFVLRGPSHTARAHVYGGPPLSSSARLETSRSEDSQDYGVLRFSVSQNIECIGVSFRSNDECYYESVPPRPCRRSGLIYLKV